jgi:Lrp/AsnC family transcriptional regulator, leucine-responsive regulatory protein
MIDNTDLKILECLKNNSRLHWKEIGEIVHMTGQAVAARVEKMKELEIIRYFTVALDYSKIGKSVLAFITIFMKSTKHAAFQDFIKSSKEIQEAHRISGDGCYWLKVCVNSQESLNTLLDEILKYGNYRLSLSISTIV